jgi:hypothetical protein
MLTQKPKFRNSFFPLIPAASRHPVQQSMQRIRFRAEPAVKVAVKENVASIA